MFTNVPFLATYADDIEWDQNVALFDTPAGPRRTHPNLKVKLLVRDDDLGHVAAIVKFPPGHREEPHAHAVAHSVLVLEGEQHVAGKILKKGDYHYAPSNVQHGPFEYPVGCTIFAAWQVPKQK